MAATALPAPEPGAVRTTPTGVPCPRCGAPLDPYQAVDGMVVCACGHQAFAGYVAEAAALDARLAWLRDRVAAGDPAPDPVLAREYGVWSAPGSAVPSAPAAAFEATSTQTLLLTFGATLLVLAALVFAAVMWPRLGALGQVLFLGSLTVGIAVLAIRLRRRLPGTAEALAAVAFGLTVVDLVSAPRLGFLPKGWLDIDTPYLALAASVLAAASLAAGHVARLRAWVWLGWGAVVAACGFATLYVGHLVGGTPATYAAALALLTVPAVGLLALSSSSALADDRDPLRVSGGCALAIGGPAVLVLALTPDAAVGALAAILATTAAVAGVWAWGRSTVAGTAALYGSAAALAVALLLPADLQPVWLGAVAGVAGVVLLAVLAATDRLWLGVSAAAVLWGLWTFGRLAALGATAETELDATADVVRQQVMWLAAVGGVGLFVVAWARVGGSRASWLGWAGACAGEAALLLAAPGWAPQVPEAATLPFALLLLAAGLLGTRGHHGGSLLRYGPALTVALVPSALLAWGAPWVAEGVADTGSTTQHVVRLVAVLAVGGGLMVVGAWRHLAGVLLPASVAVGIAAGAQVWSGFLALPRWVALALAGTALLVAGARIEWLRREGHKASSWLHGLT